MSRPKCYDPEEGQYAQLLCRYKCSEWEHCDYATTRSDLEYLMGEYSLAYRGTGMELKYIMLPQKYWDKPAVEADRRARHDKIIAARRAAKLAQEPPLFVNQQGELTS